MKVLLFEPHLSNRGHTKEWCWSLYKLLNNDIISKIIFLDFDDILKKTFKEKTMLETPYEIINISKTRSPQITSRGLKRIKQGENIKKWYSEIIKKINSLNSDLMIVSSQDTYFMYKEFKKINIKKIYTVHTVNFIPVLHKEKYKKRNLIRKFNGIKISNIIRKSINNDKLLVLEESTRDYLKKSGIKKTYSIPYISFSQKEINSDSEKGLIKNNRFIIPGMIYEGKNHDFVLNAINKNKNKFKNINIHIAGYPRKGYGTMIVEEAKKLKEFGVTGNFKYLSNNELREEIKLSKFVIIPYSKIRWDQTSGIMYDAIKNNRPIIVPDILPFKNYLKKYNFGLSYKENDYDSFINTLYKATETPIDIFIEEIKKFKLDNTTDKIKEKFKEILLE